MDDRRFQEDGRNHRERMLAGDQYVADDPDLVREMNRAAVLCGDFNATRGDDWDGRFGILRELLGSVGDGVVFRPPVQFDYGYQTHVGRGTFANWGLVVVDVGRVTIGEDVKMGPGVHLYTATHPTEPGPRRARASRPTTR